MMKEIVLVGAMMAMSVLIVAKSDKQFIHLLEGKLFRLQRDTREAKIVFRRNERPISVAFFVIGFALIGVSVILVANGSDGFLISSAISLIFVGLGIWGRISTFREADRELDGASIGRRSRGARK